MSGEGEYDLVIVGGGPAGMGAAVEAREAGLSVRLVDERASLGGQIYKQFGHGFQVLRPESLGHEFATGQNLIRRAQSSGADISLETTAWGIWGHQVALVTQSGDHQTVTARHLLLAPGAYDRPVIFPGWTLPGVMTAGAAQSLVKVQRVLPGRRILMAGSGPLILAFTAQLHRLGANIVGMLEAAPGPRAGTVASLVAAGPGNVRLLLEGLNYLAYLRRARIPVRYSSMVTEAEGEGEVQQATVARVGRDWRQIPGTEERLDVDTICLGYGLFPSNELTRLCDCEHRYDEVLGGWIPVRDEWMRTSVPSIFAAGDASGIAGSDVALQEGRLAALAAAGETGSLDQAEVDRRAGPIRRRLARLERFRAALNRMYPVGSGVYELARPDTIVCRCEEVTAGEIAASLLPGSRDPDPAKAVTRAGMGNCQGRNCGRHIAAIVARHSGRPIHEIAPFTARPPVKPVAVTAIAARFDAPEGEIELDREPEPRP